MIAGFTSGLIMLLPASALAQTAKRSPLLRELSRCRTIAAPTERLGCLDKAAAAIDEAETDRQIVVVDKEQATETSRRLFGVKLPSSPVFGIAPEVEQIETTLKSSSVDGMGHLTFTLADGSTWVQTDDNPVPGKLKSGDAVIVKRAALGAYRLSVGTRQGVKVRRLL